MFEVTFANWAPPARLLLDEVSEVFGIFFLIYRCAVGFAILSVIQAVFIQQTMKTVQLDENLLMQQASRHKAKYTEKLRRVFLRLDKDGDGKITWDEFEPLLTKETMKVMMSTLEVDVNDLKTLFGILADEDGEIIAENFVSGIQNIKGQAKALDMVSLINMVKKLDEKVDNINFRAPSPRSLRGTACAFPSPAPAAMRSQRAA
mmetsp:Transcript_41219/g.122316  ORF Transcript_41219/g.122316 Transcript_41219/m.122316 type:complete len:204 (+) Transcript_41219:3-614(+)